MGCELTAFVWIARPCVAHCVVEMIMKCLNVIRANPSPFMLLRCIMRVNVIHVDPLPFHVLKLHYVHRGEFFKKGFHVLK